MKKRYLLLLAALPILATTARAQTFALDRGSWLVGGTAGFNSQKSSGADSRTTFIFLDPDAQYFVAPGLALGGSLRLARSGSGSSHVSWLGAGPAVTYYFGRAPRPLHPYVGGSALLLRAQATGGPANTGTQLGVQAGLLLMLARNVGLDTGIYYDRSRNRANDYSSDMSVYGLQLGIAAFLF